MPQGQGCVESHAMEGHSAMKAAKLWKQSNVCHSGPWLSPVSFQLDCYWVTLVFPHSQPLLQLGSFGSLLLSWLQVFSIHSIPFNSQFIEVLIVLLMCAGVSQRDYD